MAENEKKVRLQEVVPEPIVKALGGKKALAFKDKGDHWSVVDQDGQRLKVAKPKEGDGAVTPGETKPTPPSETPKPHEGEGEGEPSADAAGADPEKGGAAADPNAGGSFEPSGKQEGEGDSKDESVPARRRHRSSSKRK